MDIFEVIDHQVLMDYLAEDEEEMEERRPRQAKIDSRFLTDFSFLAHFRFSKEGFEKLLRMVGPLLVHASNRGGGVDPAIQLQAGLNHLAGVQFQRTTGLSYGGSQTNARHCIIKVVEAVLTLKDQCPIPLHAYKPREA